MSESDITKKHINKGSLPSHVVEVIKILEKIPNVPITTEFYNENSDASVKLLELYQKLIHTDIGLSEPKKCIDDEYIVASKVPSRLPQNVIQHWVNTGYLPYQSCIDKAERSDTGSSLSEEGSLYDTSANVNIMNLHKLNNKQLCNNSSTNSSVDTAAYILSNTNIRRKENICSKFFKQDEILKMHKNIKHKDSKTDTAVNVYDTIDSNISNRKCISDICTGNKLYQPAKDLEKTNVMEETFVLKSSTSQSKNIDEICKYDKKVDGENHNCQNRKFSADSIEKTVSINNKQIFHFESLHNDSIRFCRQKKLYSGRDSPTDIVIAQSKDNSISKEKRDLHPAFRNSPFLQKSYKKLLHKRRKRKFFLKATRNKIHEDSTSSYNSTNNDIDKIVHPAKRQKTSENTENHVKIISPTMEKEKLRQSCEALRKQIERFSTTEFMNMEELKQSNKDRVSREDIKLNEKKLVHKYNLREKKRMQDNTLHKKLNPVIVLERLSEKIIRDYTRKNNLQYEIQEKNDAQLKNMTKDTNKYNLETRSIILNNTAFPMEPENVIVNSVDSDASTIIIYNCRSVKSTINTDSDTSTVALNCVSLSSNSGNVDKSQLTKLLNDVKLTRKQPVVVLERLRTTGFFKTTKLDKLNNVKNNLQPVVSLERIDNIYTHSIHRISSFTYNRFNETNVNKIESRKANEKPNQNYKHRKKLLRFQTNMNDSDSQSDSDVSFHCIFNLCTSTKSTITNEISSNSLKTSMPTNSKNTKNNKKRSSKKPIIEQQLDSKHISIHNSDTHALINNESNILKKVSSIDKLKNSSINFNKRDNKKVNNLIDRFESDTSKEDEDIHSSNMKKTVIKTNNNNKTNRFTFCTKAYDSDSD